jgi:ATP-binding cassette subfamily C protein
MGIVWLSALLNVLTLAGSIYMMLVYDFVLPSRSVGTLLGLLVMVAVAYAFQGSLEFVRTQLLANVGSSLNIDLAPRVHRLLVNSAVRGDSSLEAMRPTRDLDQLRAFLSSSGPSALIDLPWVVFFIIVLGLFHFWLGFTAFMGALILLGLAVYTDRKSTHSAQAATTVGAERHNLMETSYRYGEEIRALGMGERMESAWEKANYRYLNAQQRLATMSSGLGGVGRIFRTFLQSWVLTVGALLVIDDKASAGVIFAGSILGARALAPIDQSISNWKNFVAARQSWQRLEQALHHSPKVMPPLALPAPVARLEVEQLTLVPPGTQRPSVFGVSLALKAGDGMIVVGASASGKSSLARGLVGIWPAAQGKVRLDDAAIDQWSPDQLGRHVGYLPQNVELLNGTIAQNIARFEIDAPADAIIAAGRAAGVHEMILHLPQGYDTMVGQGGHALSAGHRQRVALARALYRDPFLLVLDEPNSNLDAQGEAALVTAIKKVRDRGGIVICIAHRQGVLEAVNYALVMHEGRVRAVGPKQEVMERMAANRQPTGIEVTPSIAANANS